MNTGAQNVSGIALNTRWPRWRLAAALSVLLVAACADLPVRAQAPTEACAAKQSDIRMPSGADFYRLKALRESRPVKVYVDVLRFGDSAEQKSPFPPEMAARTEFSTSAMTRLLSDTILQSQLFEVFDLRSTVTAEQSDIVIDAQILEAIMARRPADLGRQRALVRVTLSLQMKDVYTGQNMFPAAVKVDGVVGASAGDGTVLPAGGVEAAPIIQRQLILDFNNALRRSFTEAVYRINAVVRPMGRVEHVDGCNVALFGGSRHGIHANDELVVFRPTVERRGDREVLTQTRPIARLRCDGTGIDQANCRTIVLAAGSQPQPGDYALVSDESMRGERTR